MKWNPEQSLAINATGRNILVSASAGAGKTAVLVERLTKRCLVDRIGMDEILAVTFTDAAANEMKKRLSKRLNEEYTSPNADKEYIQKQLVLLQNARISTIHSFCLDLIKKHADALGLDPAIANTILEDGQVELAKQNAFESVLQEMLTTQFDETLQCAHYFSPRSEDFEDFKDAILTIMKTAAASLDEDAWYKNAQMNYQHIKTPADITPALAQLFFAACRLDVDIQLQGIEECLKYCLLHAPENEKVIQSINLKLDFTRDVYQYIDNKDIDGFIRSFRSALSKDIKAITKDEYFKDTLCKNLKTHRENCISKYVDFETMKNDSNEMSSLVETCLTFARKVSIAFKQNKLELRGIDFDDMEQLAYQVLKADNQRIAKIYQLLFKEILIDEFQDTNEIQNELLTMVSNGNNVFRVGDVKQSIYKFRKAKPEIMRTLMNDESVENITLAYNYRSNQSIVQFTNDLFRNCMNVEGCRDVYLERDFVQPGTPSQMETSNPVEFYKINTASIKEDHDSLENKQIKAHFIAQKIVEMKNSTSYNKWSDFVIITRTHGDKNLIKQVFDEYNIPYSIDAKEGFYQSYCCAIVLSMLRLVEDIDEISLLSVLTSPLYFASDDECANLKLSSSSLWEGCLKFNHPLVNDIYACREILKSHGLCSLLNKIATINNFVDQGLDQQQRTNFDLLFEKATQFEKTSISLRQFIQQIDLNIQEKSNEAVALGPEEDVVRSVTIHHSKGLQYKVVFYWSTSENKLKDKANALLVDSELGVAFHSLKLPYRFRRPTFQRIALEYKINLDDLEEGIRVLYVALTRAESKLIIVDNIDKEINPTKLTLQHLNKRKGMTYTILNSLGNNDNFTIYTVNELKVQPKNYRHETTQIELPKYQLTDASIESLSPSSTENYFVPQLTFDAISSSSRGNLVHKWIEILPNRVWTNADFNDSELSLEDREKLIRFSESKIYKQCLSMDIHKEFPFAVRNDNKLIQGSVDFIAVDDQAIILIDFKTDRNVTQEILLQRYSQQINTYKIALSILFPQRVIEAYICSFDLETFIHIK